MLVLGMLTYRNVFCLLIYTQSTFIGFLFSGARLLSKIFTKAFQLGRTSELAYKLIES